MNTNKPYTRMSLSSIQIRAFTLLNVTQCFHQISIWFHFSNFLEFFLRNQNFYFCGKIFLLVSSFWLCWESLLNGTLSVTNLNSIHGMVRVVVHAFIESVRVAILFSSIINVSKFVEITQKFRKVDDQLSKLSKSQVSSKTCNFCCFLVNFYVGIDNISQKNWPKRRVLDIYVVHGTLSQNIVICVPCGIAELPNSKIIGVGKSWCKSSGFEAPLKSFWTCKLDS